MKIDISIENNLLKVVIEDNGVGRARSNEFKKESIYHSVAMKLTEERLEMINKIENTENIKVIVSDLHNEEQQVWKCERYGCKVEIYFDFKSPNVPSSPRKILFFSLLVVFYIVGKSI